MNQFIRYEFSNGERFHCRIADLFTAATKRVLIALMHRWGAPTVKPVEEV